MITSVLHRAAGLIVAADRPLSGFVPAAPHERPDLRIHLESPPAWHDAPSIHVHATESQDRSGDPIVTASRSPEGFHFRYADRTRVWIAANGSDVWCTWPRSASLADTCTYLSGPILGLVLRLRGALAFHASAVQIGAGAVGFVGPHAAGKSTLAAALGAAGCPVVTDDVLHVRAGPSGWVAEPFSAMLKLWPGGARLALGASAELPVIAEGWDKRALRIGGTIPAATAPISLLALACFEPRDVRSILAPISPATGLVRLAANSSAAHLLDNAGRAAEFQALSLLVRSVPCVTITPPIDVSAYPAFVANVLGWARALNGSAPG